jgi:DNA-binding transcriptional MerR regulator
MPASLAIGDFAKATHLTVKTLRHYHEAGLLRPVDIDPNTGYRRYSVEQIPTAQIIRRFRDLDMPLKEIQAVMSAPDVATRNELIAAHLERLEGNLRETQNAVASLRGLLRNPTPEPKVVHRRVEATSVAAITDVVDLADLGAWFRGAFGELAGTLAAQGLTAVAPRGGIYANGIFTEAHGEATVFIPCGHAVRSVGRVRPQIVPAAELAIIEHRGTHANIDMAYGSLATHVAQHALGVDGPLREYYLVGQMETSRDAEWRTEIGWPIFQTA